MMRSMQSSAIARCRAAIFFVLMLSACRASTSPSDDRAVSAGKPERAAIAAPSESVTNETVAAAPIVIRPFPGIVVHPQSGIVEVSAVVCLDGGWLEQIACTTGTREHEALVVVHCQPSHVHAALLMAGFEAGSPGRWTYDDQQLELVPPTGTPMDVLVRQDRDGVPFEHPVAEWVRDSHGEHDFPASGWVFAGSMFDRDGAGAEHYVADLTGSVIGLVTFGDEVIGFAQVLADEAAVQAPEWEVDPDAIPPVGTPVTLVLKKRPAP
jgi:hypothetical protein